jgi:hypothetical protein
MRLDLVNATFAQRSTGSLGFSRASTSGRRRDVLAQRLRANGDRVESSLVLRDAPLIFPSERSATIGSGCSCRAGGRCTGIFAGARSAAPHPEILSRTRFRSDLFSIVYSDLLPQSDESKARRERERPRSVIKQFTRVLLPRSFDGKIAGSPRRPYVLRFCEAITHMASPLVPLCGAGISHQRSRGLGGGSRGCVMRCVRRRQVCPRRSISTRVARPAKAFSYA